MTKTIFLITSFILTLSCFQVCYSQSGPIDFNTFDYHEVFCKEQNATKKIKTDKKLQKFNIVKYYASQLVNEGKVSFDDTISRYLNKTCERLKLNDPTFDFQIAIVKKSTSGFLSVNKNMVYLYIGTITRLINDEELTNLLYIIAKNHSNPENYQIKLTFKS